MTRIETNVAILQQKAENDRFPLPDDLAEYIARDSSERTYERNFVSPLI